MRKLVANLILLALITGAGLLATEWAVRQVAPQVLVRGYSVPDPDLGTYVAANADYTDPYTKEGAYRVRTNAHAFRMDEKVDLSADRRRVLVYGDSFTFGWGLELKDTYYRALHRAARALDPRLQLLNAGVGGYASGHVKKLLERHLPAIKPAAAIYFFNSNDLIDNTITDVNYRVTAFRIGDDGRGVLDDVRPFAPWKRFLLNHTPYAWLNRHSHLFLLAKDLLKRGLAWTREIDRPVPGGGGGGADAQPAFSIDLPPLRVDDAYLARTVYVSELHVARLAAVAAAADVPLLLVWVPAPDEMFPPKAQTETLQLLARGRRMLSRLAAETPGTFFLDTARLIPDGPAWQAQKGTLRLSDGHFNAAGTAWFAGLVEPGVLAFLDNAVAGRAK
ncbi:MAG: GDSL-type esterase/lipase family protein [Magnetovibrio sp.]|nr:GDSL-type esterase/lipase family protein [Magnetovibrio sp.]